MTPCPVLPSILTFCLEINRLKKIMPVLVTLLALLFTSAKFKWVHFWVVKRKLTTTSTLQKMKLSIKDFFSKCEQIRTFLRIWSHLLKKSLMESFIFYAVLKIVFFLESTNLDVWQTCKYAFVSSFYGICHHNEKVPNFRTLSSTVNTNSYRIVCIT